MDEISLNVNGDRRIVTVEPGTSLRAVLRENIGLTGTKVGCEVGKCGACTVLKDGDPVKSCLIPAHQAADSEVTTVEGLTDDEGDLHPVQKSFIEMFGFQCGYCTPGFIMNTVALLDNRPNPERNEIAAELKGNLCRCTGYEKIFDAVEQAAERSE